MIEPSARLGTAPPAPRLIVGRGQDLARIRERLLDGLDQNAGVVDINGEALRKAIRDSGLTKSELVNRIATDEHGRIPQGAVETIRRTLNNAENGSRVREDFAKKLSHHLRDELRHLTKSPAIRTVVAIHAHPGLGKTTVLQSLCHDDAMRAALPDGTLWASLGQKPDIQRILLQWAVATGIRELQGFSGSGEETSSLIRGMLNAALSDKRLLILLDDVWKPEHASALLVGGSGCPALISTRQPAIAHDLATFDGNVALRRLSEEESIHLLELIAGDIIKKHAKSARAIAVALEGHPLGLQVAGKLVSTSHNSGLEISVLMSKLERPDELLDLDIPSEDGLPSRTVGAVFKVSTDTLTDIQRLCFAFLSSWEAKPAQLTMKMMEQTWIPFGIDSQKMAQVLVGRGLLEYRDHGVYSMHSLLVAHGRSLLRSLRGGEESGNDLVT